MNHFAIKFAVNARSLCRFGLGLAFVQHQIDRALAQSHVCVSPNAAKIFSLFNPHSPGANFLRDAHLPRHTRFPASTVSFCETSNPTQAPTRDYPMSPYDNALATTAGVFAGTPRVRSCPIDAGRTTPRRSRQ
jgi:hypothetical protein